MRRSEPPALIELDYELILVSPEPAQKLEKLHKLAVEWGTVTNTLMDGIAPRGAMRIERSYT